MKYVYGTLVGLLIASVIVFALQNGSQVTISFLTMSATLPLALLVVVAYASGMVTGGSLTGLVRSWLHAASKR